MLLGSLVTMSVSLIASWALVFGTPEVHGVICGHSAWHYRDGGAAIAETRRLDADSMMIAYTRECIAAAADRRATARSLLVFGTAGSGAVALGTFVAMAAVLQARRAQPAL